MDLQRLFCPQFPWLHLRAVEGNSGDLRDELSALVRDGQAIRIVRGNKSRSKASFFTEVAAALQFPDYFGENWDALDECLCDLEWLPDPSFVLIITRGTELLNQEPLEELSTCLQCFEAAARFWCKEVADSSVKSFHVVLECDLVDLAQLEVKLHQCDIEFDRL